jgi:hypothetical protein
MPSNNILYVFWRGCAFADRGRFTKIHIIKFLPYELL